MNAPRVEKLIRQSLETDKVRGLVVDENIVSH
jgi:hypothetical protein